MICGLFFLFLYLQSNESRRMLNKNGAYTKGIVLGISKGARGSKYLNYEFYINNHMYTSSTSMDFCTECKYLCCNVGDSVNVHYQKDNPGNCVLVHEVPN